MPVLNVPKSKKRTPEEIRAQRRNIAETLKGHDNATLKALKNKMFNLFGEGKKARAAEKQK